MVIAERPVLTALHPLEPLAPDEISEAVRILRAAQSLGPRALLHHVDLLEPPKDEVYVFAPGDPFERRAHITVLDHDDGRVHEATVSITQGKLLSWEHIPGAQPGLMLAEFIEMEGVIKADAGYADALAKRGVTDMDLVQIDAWSAGNFGYEDEEGVRLVRAYSWVRDHPRDNAYAHPIEGVIAVVDVNRMNVIRVEDYGLIPVPKESANYAEDLVGPLRSAPKAIEITQPEGPSFEVEGHCVKWMNWQIRFGFTQREGLVLHQASYDDNGRLRPILYRASLSEMVVPYGDPSPTQNRKNAFDAGEYGIGMLANSLELGCDCLGEIRYFDGVITGGDGKPITIKNAICMHEEDASILWKHTDRGTGAEVRRSRRLVLSSISTVGNYEYGFYWHFYLDGMIEVEVKLTGIISTGALPPGEKRKYGTLVAPGVYGPIHQHNFNFRLDFAVDGEENTVVEVNTIADDDGPQNPHGNGFYTEGTPLTRELEAQRIIDPFSARYWLVTNPSSRNWMGDPVAYKLMPGENALPFNRPTSSLIKRAGFATRHLWVTPFNERERHAAGDYINQHAGNCGLPEWTAANRAIEDTDVVVWYTLGHHHVVRLEDWPVTPSYSLGFKLMPSGFFDRNPAINLPRPKGHAECHDG